MAQAKLFLDVVANESHPLHRELTVDKGSRIKRGKSWMAEAEDSVKKVCRLEQITKGKEWIEVGVERRSLTRVIISMGRERREVAAVINETEIQDLILRNSEPDDPIIYTDGSVQNGRQNGWGFVVYIQGRIAHTASGATLEPTSSMRMKVEAITKAL